MKSNERIFRYPYGRFLLLYFALLSFLGFGFGVISLKRLEPAFWLMTVVIGLVLLIFYLTSGARISDEEIVTKKLLTSKSIKWSEIVRVSICGYHNLRMSSLIGSFSNNGNSLILQGVDENLKLTIATDPKRYLQLVGILFKKRPDLFETNKGYVIDFLTTKSTIREKLFWEFLFIASSVFIIYKTGFPPAAWILGIFLSAYFFFSMLGSSINNPFNIVLENNTLRFIYLSGKIVKYPVNEILSIRLEKVWASKSKIIYSTFPYEETLDNKNFGFEPSYDYYTYHNVYVDIKDKNPVILKWSGQLIYLILKNWHKRNTSIGQTNQQN